MAENMTVVEESLGLLIDSEIEAELEVGEALLTLIDLEVLEGVKSQD